MTDNGTINTVWKFTQHTFSNRWTRKPWKVVDDKFCLWRESDKEFIKQPPKHIYSLDKSIIESNDAREYCFKIINTINNDFLLLATDTKEELLTLFQLLDHDIEGLSVEPEPMCHKYHHNSIFGGRWSRKNFTYDDEKICFWKNNESLNRKKAPKYTYYYSRCQIEKNNLKKNCLKVIDISSAYFLIFALDSEDDYNCILNKKWLKECTDTDTLSFTPKERRGTIFNSAIGGRSKSTDEENHSDDDEVDYTKLNQTNDKSFRLYDPKLTILAKEIEMYEKEFIKAHLEKKKIWKNNESLKFDKICQEFETKIEDSKLKIEKEFKKGPDHVAAIEAEINKIKEELHTLKAKYYFPFYAKVLYSDFESGIYLSYENFFLESLKGHIAIDLIPNEFQPTINIVISSPINDSEEAGLNVRAKIYGLKLKGEKKSGIPTIKLDSAKLTMKIIIILGAVYDVKTNIWKASDNFSINLVSFRGPLGLGRRVVYSVIKRVMPGLKDKIIKEIPVELGIFIMNLPSPATFRLDFTLIGTNLDQLKSPYSTLMKSSCLATSTQIEMFIMMQKYAMSRSNILSSISDIIVYFNNIQKNDKHLAVFQLWEQACTIYSENLRRIKNEEALGIKSDYNFSFIQLLDGAKAVGRKHLTFNLDFKELTCEFTLASIILLQHKLSFKFAFDRLCHDEFQSEFKQSSIKNEIKLLHSQLMEAISTYVFLSKNIDQLELKLNVCFKSGSDSQFEVKVNDIIAKMPVFLNIPMKASVVSLPYSKTPFVIRNRPHMNGDYSTEWEASGLGYGGDSDRDSSNIVYNNHKENNNNRKSFRSSLSETFQSISVKNRHSLFDGLQNSTKLLKKQQTVDEEKKIIALNDLNTYVDVFNRNSQIRLEAQTVTEQDYRNKLADLLKDCDTELSDVISVLYVKRPQIRGIISENMTLEKGTELFGVKFVDNEESSQLLGGESKKEITTDIYLPEELLLYRNEAEDINTSLLIQWDLDIRETLLRRNSLLPILSGCNTFLSTAPNILFEATVPELSWKIFLPSWIRLLNNFLVDFNNYKDLCFATGYGDFSLEGIGLFQVLLTVISKYIFTDSCIHIDFNSILQLHKKNNELYFKFETPQLERVDDNFFQIMLDFDFRNITDDIERIKGGYDVYNIKTHARQKKEKGEATLLRETTGNKGVNFNKIASKRDKDKLDTFHDDSLIIDE